MPDGARKTPMNANASERESEPSAAAPATASDDQSTATRTLDPAAVEPANDAVLPQQTASGSDTPSATLQPPLPDVAEGRGMEGSTQALPDALNEQPPGGGNVGQSAAPHPEHTAAAFRYETASEGRSFEDDSFQDAEEGKEWVEVLPPSDTEDKTFSPQSETHQEATTPQNLIDVSATTTQGEPTESATPTVAATEAVQQLIDLLPPNPESAVASPGAGHPAAQTDFLADPEHGGDTTPPVSGSPPAPGEAHETDPLVANATSPVSSNAQGVDTAGGGSRSTEGGEK